VNLINWDAIDTVRLDRWLWAARFYKTRAQAKTAIQGGKVDFHVLQDPAGATIRPKVSKEVVVGDVLTIRRGWSATTVSIQGLSEQRGNATSASALYQETADSIELREIEIARRRMEKAGLSLPRSRPSKRDRRQLKQLKEES